MVETSDNKKREIYLDNAATTMVAPEVVDAMIPYFTERYGNPSSIHHKGNEARKGIAEARRKIAAKINASPEEIIFTSGGSESDNLALQGLAHSLQNKGKHIISTSIEHPAIKETLQQLKKEGFEITFLNTDEEGIITVKTVEEAIRDDTILVSIMHANNEIGTIQNLESIGKLCAEKKIPLHSDCVQSFCKVPIDVKKMNISMASFASHKVHGPKGVGALYLKRGVRVQKLIHGGNQESRFRAGTENVPGIVGFGKAVEMITDADIAKMVQLRDKLVDSILNEVEHTELNGSKENRICNSANISFDFIEGESILLYLDKFGICVSTGSACSSQSLEPSPVLLAIGVPRSKAHSTIRFTLSKYTTEEDIDFVIEKVKYSVSKLRGVSPIKTDEQLAKAEKMTNVQH